MPTYVIVSTSESELDSSMEWIDAGSSVEWVVFETSGGFEALRAPSARDVPPTVLASPLLQLQPTAAIASTIETKRKNNRSKSRTRDGPKHRETTIAERHAKRLAAIQVTCLWAVGQPPASISKPARQQATIPHQHYIFQFRVCFSALQNNSATRISRRALGTRCLCKLTHDLGRQRST